ncbi:hypothetical protein EV191_10467 [Tamaricihabitans halophyticus]|uniref:Uncharacterized protein n=1 Tax=Tamaricihabitans halophyticus TaxID=1262583 RepID=A0A4R2QU67_9PSEU|nr:hypothetical protein EV191_10467 [Tamaricihabitans halophyticus]
MIVSRGKAGRLAHGAVDVGDRPTRPAHEMVVVVASARFVPRYGTVRLDTPKESGGGQRTEDVVDGLVGHLTETRAYGTDDGLRIRVRTIMDSGEHRDTRARYA